MKNTTCLRLLFCLCLGAGAGANAAATADAEDLTVHVHGGQVRGVGGDGFIAFKGIPYAAPPVRNLRWRPPEPAPVWAGVREAARFQSDCSQDPFPYDAAPSAASFGEDCLYVNVWKPAAPAAKIPVMVWIYGGGFVNGGTSPAIYDGSAFAKHGVLLISFNYRVGNFGFFAHPALSGEQPDVVKGNYGLMDQIAALKWVRANAAAFGGDAGNVTVFGESAGGMSIHYLMSSPLAVGLFDKAIIESGGGRPGPFGSRPLSGTADSAEAMGVRLAQRVGVDGVDAAALAKLRALPAQTFSKGLHMGTMGSYGPYVGGPIRDGRLIVGDPATLYQQGVGPRIPVIVGATDGDLGFASGTTVEELLTPFGEDAQRARALFDPAGNGTVRQIGAAIGGTQFMIEPARYVARLLAARGQPVYEYRFSYVAEALRSTTPGAPHASELPYVFDTVGAALGARATAADLHAGETVHAYWVAFARTGTPHVPGAPLWPAYDASRDEMLNFSTAGPIAGVDPWQPRLDLAARVSGRHLHVE